MKKYFLILTLMLTAMACSPLKVALNKTDSEGVRTIVTSSQNLFQDFDMALGVRISKEDTIMGIIVSTESSKLQGVFNEDDHLYMVLKDGSKITLHNILNQDAVELRKETKTDYNYSPGWTYAYGPWGRRYWIEPYAATSYFERTYETTVADSYALYPITYNEMVQIISKGVEQLSIEVDNDTRSMMLTDGLQEQFARMFQCLGDGVRHPNDY